MTSHKYSKAKPYSYKAQARSDEKRDDKRKTLDRKQERASKRGAWS